MDYEAIKDKLDNLVEAKNIYDANMRISNDICVCSQFETGIQLFHGIEELADIMGCELKEEINQCSSFPYKYQFMYRNVPFFQISEKRLQGYGNEE